ncbi:MAG: galactose-1-phosphate uridylyltransferase [Chloroflexota bacterium]|jgi:UDPglucose--hexose-1-phosphate uridylyltransferase|nr:galactose-1-phosphate uridylyltransferase [Chloroflexota bacterium]
MQPAPPPRRGRLADGREILYFDDPGPARPAPPPDRRDLPSRGEPADLRRDALLDEWVLVATHRQDRTHLPAASDCPLCPSRDGLHTEIPAAEYDVVAFENRFPSLPAAVPGEAAHGRCDVIVYSSDHDASFSGLPEVRLRTIAAAWGQRTAELGAQAGVANVFCFENRGEEIGVTLHHPHGQVYAYPFVPPRIERMLGAARRHHDATGRCIGCDLLAAEVNDGERIVLEGEHAVAYVPRAARWPYEAHLVPRRHVPDLAALSDEERDEAVMLQADLLRRLDSLFDRPAPYMAGWLQAPTSDGRELHHLRLQVVTPRRAASKLKFLAGSESLAGAWINDIRPEEAAQRLREAGS